MKKRNIKGFTLIELLAVIIIMGILMMTAIPAVTKYIENSRKDTFWQTAKSYIDAAKTSLLSGEYKVVKANSNFSDLVDQECDLPPIAARDTTNKKLYMYYTSIDIKDIEMEKGKGKSSFNRSFGTTAGQGFVIAINRGWATTIPDDLIRYYFVGYDAGGNGIKYLTSEDTLARKHVLKGTAKTDSTAIKLQKNVTSTPTDLATGSTVKVNGEDYTLYYRLYAHCTVK